MLDDQIAKLSDAQKQCLRLTAEGRSSKEMAPIVGLTYQTVDQYLHRACQALGAANRREAARIFAEIERSTSFREPGSRGNEVAQPKIPAISHGLAEQEQRSAGLLSPHLTEGSPYDLNRAEQFFETGRIALFLMICILAMTVLVRGAFIVLS